MDIQAKAVDILKKHGKAMTLEMVDELVFIALEEVVKDSSNPFDDAMLAVLKEPLRQALIGLVNKI